MEINEKQENYNYNQQPYKSEKKLVAGLLGILLGTFAIHKFYLGYTKTGIIQLVLGIVTCGIVGIVGFIEGIIYLTKSDEEFDRTYVQNQKEWF
ncbi:MULTISPECIES: TM2 domain-containing protein [Chryseobacterium]|uniref:TM2 domain-containing membrane protein YozV n=1 Tax=Chryseobacterium geocarposphaerae TaxID=1416776 RepID=A0A2M9C7F0_9FLAO|nr:MULTISPECIES: TM2 domain-containing protein [Chryseobacterium]PJJ66722.1 TM2 domain-containing membrane protein YozV [Chryseobacterium geocarposphaerae]UMQ42476.1 TM2 domain-containing protein [Chryseobacterium sp. Y16C]